jgi:enoyl-CoA hydratase/carnithine racemase
VIETIWIDNPPLNVLAAEVLEALRDGLASLAPETRVVVLRGRGDRAFSAGGDIASFREPDPTRALGIQTVVTLLETAPVPVVAAIQGYCFGGGLEVALGCDIRIAHSDARLGFPEVGLGLLPGGGGTQRAPRLIGPGRAAWLLMSGERISAARAAEWGLVEFVVDDLEAGIEQVAGTLAAQSPNSLRETKALLHATREQPSDDQELAAFLRCLRSPEGQEGMAAFFEKRKPDWGAG